MLTMLLESMGHRLAKKPFEWMSWWWSVRWGDFISIDPQLTKENPLWSLERDDNSLKSIRLFELYPDELQAEIARYWEKSFWRQWLSRLFTPIESKITIWSYYQRCLSFREVQRQNPQIDQRLIIYTPEQSLVSVLVKGLNKDNLAFENYLEKNSGNLRWMQNNFNSILNKYEKKRENLFLNRMEKELKKLPENANRDLARRKATKEYQQVEKIMKAYLQIWFQNTFYQRESSTRIEVTSNALVYVGPAVVAERPINPSLGSDPSCSMYMIADWVRLKRQTIETMLQAERPDYASMQFLLEQSLNSLRLLIEPQLQSYQGLADEVRWQRINYKEAVQRSEALHARLNSFFHSSSLLFHPDKSFGNEELRKILTELFKQFHQLAEASSEEFIKGIQVLKSCIPQWKFELDKILEETERDRREFREMFYQTIANLKAERATCKEEFETTHAQDKADLEAKRAQDKADLEAKRAQDKADLEAKRTQDKVDFEAKLAEEKEERAREKAATDAQIEQLRQLLLVQKTTVNLSSEDQEKLIENTSSSPGIVQT
jgi:hypothetical protein